MPGSIHKAQIRNRIWGLLTRAGVSLMPGAYGRTPTFHGVREIVAHLRQTDAWSTAQRVLVLSEPVLKHVRQAAVADGKTLIVPDLSRTHGWVVEIDPRRMDPSLAHDIAGSFPATQQEMPPGVQALEGRAVAPVDLMVIGAVGVDLRGARVGKGIGEADLVYALGREREFIRAETPVLVLVHELQVLEEPAVREATDLPVDMVITTGGLHHIQALRIRPKGLEPSLITPERLAVFPGLQRILEQEGLAGPPDPPTRFRSA